MNPKICEIETSFATREDASTMARLLFDAKLIACANVTNAITGIYEWKGKRLEEQEFLLRAKTSPRLEQQCMAMIRKNHPYELPMITSTTRTTTQEYADWVEGHG